jgi:hypothetical protein
VVVFEEGGVAVDVAAESFAKDEFGVGDFERRVEGCAFAVLEAVFGPECLGAVRGFDYLVGPCVVGGGEGDVPAGVPVLGEDDVVELLREGVDDRNYFVAFGDGERASHSVDRGAEVVLYVDDEEGVGGLKGDGHISDYFVHDAI